MNIVILWGYMYFKYHLRAFVWVLLNIYWYGEKKMKFYSLTDKISQKETCWISVQVNFDSDKCDVVGIDSVIPIESKILETHVRNVSGRTCYMIFFSWKKFLQYEDSTCCLIY